MSEIVEDRLYYGEARFIIFELRTKTGQKITLDSGKLTMEFEGDSVPILDDVDASVTGNKIYYLVNKTILEEEGTYDLYWKATSGHEIFKWLSKIVLVEVSDEA